MVDIHWQKYSSNYTLSVIIINLLGEKISKFVLVPASKAVFHGNNYFWLDCLQGFVKTSLYIVRQQYCVPGRHT